MKGVIAAGLLASLSLSDIEWHDSWKSAKTQAEKDRKLIVVVIDHPQAGC